MCRSNPGKLTIILVSTASLSSVWCEACLLPEVAAVANVDHGFDAGATPVERVPSQPHEPEQVTAAVQNTDPIAAPSDAGKPATRPSIVDAGPAVAEKTDAAKVNACSLNNGGCDMEPLAACNMTTDAAVSCTCPGGSSGDGRGSDGCKADPVRVGPCGKFMCDETSVKDPSTALTWQRAVPELYAGCTGRYENNKGTTGDACTWHEATGYCAQLSLEASRWRLPTKDELLTIVDSSRTEPSIDLTAFPNTGPEAFWSSTPSPGLVNEEGAWYVIFQKGTSYEGFATTAVRVRCVR